MKNKLFLLLLITAQQALAQQNIEMLTFDAQQIPAGMEIRGTVLDGKHWKDANGENYFILTRTADKIEEIDGVKKKSAFLYGWHYVSTDGHFQLMRKLAEPLKECASAYSDIYPMKQSLVVSDTDGDSKAEVVFLHATVCSDDKQAPVPVQLTLLEDGERFSMRGTAAVRIDGGSRNGDPQTELQKSVYDVGAEFKAASPQLLQYAEQHWQKYAVVVNH